MGGFDLVQGLLLLIPLVLSLTVHEFAHAWSAYRLGDDTAARQGRMTLNPLPHIDPLGTIVLPLLLAMRGLPAFGWAKPVPINPAGFRRNVKMGAGMAITASAGPISNMILAVLGTVVLGVLYRFQPHAGQGGSAVAVLLSETVLLNVSLALFNLIPIPPLDGSRIVAWLMPYRMREQWEAIERFAPLLLIGVFFFGGRLIAGPSRFFIGLLNQLLNAIT